MSTRTSALRPQDEALQLITRLEQLLSTLPEPHQGVVAYASKVLKDPSIDTRFCQKVGKVVQITAKLSQKTECEITLRGHNGPLNWEEDLYSEKPTPLSPPNQKTLEVPLTTLWTGDSII